MGNLEGYSGETSTSTVDWRACATKCLTSSSCKAWQFVNSNCVMVESYQRTKAVDGEGRQPKKTFILGLREPTPDHFSCFFIKFINGL